MADVKITIGAKDQATKVLQDVGKNVQQMAEKTQSAFRNIMSVAGPFLAVFAAIKVGLDVKQGIQESINAFNEEDKVVRQLTASLKMQGYASESVSQAMIQMADNAEDLYGVSDKVTKGLMAQASQMGVGAHQMESVMEMAIGLSKATGTDLNSALKSTTELMMGNVEAMSGMIPSLKMTGNYYQQLAIVQRTAEAGLVTAQEEADGLAFAYDRMALASDDFAEMLGSVLAPIQQLAYEGMAILVEALNAAFGPALKNASDGFESFRDGVGSAATWLATAFIKAVTMIETLWNNLPTVFEIAGAGMLLSLEGMRADIEHLFTVVIPAYAVWLYDNWTNILTDMANATVSIFKNLFNNIQAFFTGGEMVSLLDGFEAKTSALPVIAARQATALEQELTGFIDESVNRIANEYQTKVESRVNAVQESFQRKEQKNNGSQIDMSKLRGLGGFMNKVGTDTPANQAVESRILSRGSVQNQQQQMAQLLQQIAQNTQATTNEVRQVNERERYKPQASQQSRTAEMTFIVPGGGN
jgi:hypothetical protein